MAREQQPARRTPRSSRTPQRRPSASSSGRPRKKPAAATTRPASRGSSATRRPRPVYKTTRRLPLGNPVRRLTWVLVGLVVVAILVTGRLFQLQALDTHAYAVAARKSAERTIDLPAVRGAITDRNGMTLAASEPAANVIVDPVAIADAGETRTKRARKKNPKAPAVDLAPDVAELLAQHLGGSSEVYLTKLRDTSSRFVVIAKNVPAAIYRTMKQAMTDQHLPGVYRQVSSIRSYPAGTVAGPILGFVNEQGQGGAGLEYRFQKELAGTPGQDAYEISAFGRLPRSAGVVKPAINGAKIQLTIDADMQATADLALQQAISTSRGDWGVLIATNPKNGEILAMSTSPSYDPGRYREFKSTELGNKAVTSSYEPGSVQKVLSWAAYADAGLVTPDSHLTVPHGLESGGHTITDAHDHGTVHWTGRGAFMKSSNVATAALSRQLGTDRFVDYMMKFGLGNKTGIELPGEASGQVRPTMRQYETDRASFGQSMTVNAVQMTAALSAAVNGGIYNPPTIIRSITGPDGKPIELQRPPSHRVISPEASAMTRDWMETVVTQSVKDQSYYGIPGWRLIGKTGTAQRSDPTCGCYRGTTASYVGVGPAEDPSLLVYMVIDNPKVADSGHAVAVPYVRDALRVMLPHYGVPMSTAAPRKDPTTW